MCLVYFPLILLPFCISWVRSRHIIQEIEPVVHSVDGKIQLKCNFKNHTAFCHGARIPLVNMDNDTVYWSLILEVVWLTLLLYQWLLIWWLHISVWSVWLLLGTELNCLLTQQLVGKSNGSNQSHFDVDVVKVTCWSSTRASEWERKAFERFKCERLKYKYMKNRWLSHWHNLL